MHTKGPWSVHTSNMTTIQGPGNENIAMPLEAWRSRDQQQMTKDEMMANARLIAAAPELLEALDTLLGWGCLRSDWAEHGVAEPTDHPLNIARRAIAKAKGEA